MLRELAARPADALPAPDGGGRDATDALGGAPRPIGGAPRPMGGGGGGAARPMPPLQSHK